jgi:hypothetical protein
LEGPKRFDRLIEKYARRFFPEEWARGRPADGRALNPPLHLLFEAQVWQESSFDPEARSPAGARGLMQLMPATDFWLDKDRVRNNGARRGERICLRYFRLASNSAWIP